MKSRSKLVLFEISAILKFDFKKENNYILEENYPSKLHKKDTILNVTITFSLKQE